MTRFHRVNRLFDEWQALQPLNPENERQLWRKLKLEWNYHSNHIEGNTLTYGETELLLIHGQTSGDHALRDYVEMQAHEIAIVHLQSLVGDHSRELSEGDIRDLNGILLKEPFWKDAITPDGHPTRIEILPGEYKTQPNNVKTASGEVFRFADPVDVPAKMSQMLASLQHLIAESPLHPIEIAGWLHHEFVLIHPFGDGNGRTARLLVNYVLMRSGYLPLIVPTEKKDSYLASLRLADAGDRASLTLFLTECAEVAMLRGIRAAKGESVQEEGDIEKEIEVFKRRQTGQIREVVVKTHEVRKRLYETSLRPLFLKLFETLKKLDDLFLRSEIFVSGVAVSNSPMEIIDKWIETPEAETGFELIVEYHWVGYRGEADEPFSENCRVVVMFRDMDYLINTPGSHQIKRLYSAPLLEIEQKQLCQGALEIFFQRIKEKTKGNE